MADLNTNQDYLALKQLAHDLQGRRIANGEYKKAEAQIEAMRQNKKKFQLKPPAEIDFNPHSADAYSKEIKDKKVNSVYLEKQKEAKKKNALSDSQSNAVCVLLTVLCIVGALVIIGLSIWLYFLFNNFCSLPDNWGIFSDCSTGTQNINYHDRVSIFYFATFFAFLGGIGFSFTSSNKANIVLTILFSILAAYALIRSIVHYFLSMGTNFGTVLLLIPALLLYFITAFLRLIAVFAVMEVFVALFSLAIYISIGIPSKIIYKNNFTKQNKHIHISRDKIELDLIRTRQQRRELFSLTPEQDKQYRKLEQQDLLNEKNSKLAYEQIYKDSLALYSQYEAEYNSQVKVAESVKQKLYNEWNKYSIAVNNNTCLHADEKKLDYVYQLIYLFEHRKADNIIQACNRLDDLKFMQTIIKEVNAIKLAVNQLINQQNIIISQNNSIAKLIDDTQKSIRKDFKEINANLNTINTSINRQAEEYKQKMEQQISLMKKQTNISDALYKNITGDIIRSF